MSTSQNLDSIIIFGKGDSFSQPDSARDSPVSIYELRKNLEAFTNLLKILLPAVADAGSGFGLKTLEVAVGVDGKGHFGLLGTDVGAQSTITMTFSR